MNIDRIDHLVLTVRNIETTIDFYFRILGMTAITFGEGRRALTFGNQKINLHQAGREYKPHADKPAPGSADLCFIVDQPISELQSHLQNQSIDVIEGPVNRTGATGPISSLYIRDPDNNLIELSNYDISNRL
jgi:catechol 2,3-dioxygenase-like lactoylglutathione lyase family enzyme